MWEYIQCPNPLQAFDKDIIYGICNNINSCLKPLYHIVKFNISRTQNTQHNTFTDINYQHNIIKPAAPTGTCIYTV